MLEDQPLPETQTQTQTQTQGNSQWELLETNGCDAMQQKVTWGQLFTKSITIHDHGRKFVVFEQPQQFSEYRDAEGCRNHRVFMGLYPIIPHVQISRRNPGPLAALKRWSSSSRASTCPLLCWDAFPSVTFG